MVNINFDFNNVGGLAEFYAIPPSDVLRIRHDYRRDIYALELKTRDNIIVVPVYGDRSFSFSEQKSTADGGDYWEVSIEGVVPKLCHDSSAIIESLDRGDWLVLHIDNNGTVHLSGSVDIPLQCSSDKSSGSSFTDLNGTTLTFSGKQPSPSLVIDLDDLNKI